MILAHRVLAVFVGTVGLVGLPVSGQPVAESLGDRVVRFSMSPEAAAQAMPSFALLSGVKANGEVPAGFPILPKMTVRDGEYEAVIDVPAGTSLYGTGEVSGPLLRNGRTVVTWNTDAYGYSDPSPSLYQSHPWVLAVRPDGTAFGVLADTTYRTVIDLTSGISFRAGGHPFQVIVVDRSSPLEVIQALGDLTGKIEMPPLWALGYHQCRYSYYPDSKVREVGAEFRKRNIPCDVLWMDIDYMNGYRCFTFDPKHFPDPSKLNADLHGQGFHSVWMIDPGIKAEPGYSVYDSGTAANAWVQTSDGSVYKGEVWPGMCVFPDYTRKDTRSWWAGLYREFMATGIDGVWNDMNEPAVFNVQTKTMPVENHHRADPDLGGPGPHARYHNVYGLLMVQATREGVMAANPTKRPFVLSRANFIGGQRYAAMWTGDNTADWSHLEASVPMALNMGLSGQPFAGPDIGGFAGNGPAGQEGQLFARWMGVGAMLPFARGHTGKENINKEPWAFGPEVETACRLAIERRYRLLPYLYTLFHEAHLKGSPVVRPVFFADPTDAALRSEDDAFLLGGDVLVVPQLVPARNREPVKPRGVWRQFAFGDANNPMLPALHLRAGAVVPTGPVMQYAAEKPLDEITLLVSLDQAGKAGGTLYEDAGEGWAFRDGEFRLSRFVAERTGNRVVVRVVEREGKLPVLDRKLTVRLLTDAGEVKGTGSEKLGVVITLTQP
jgi:alpha-glucosidase